DLLVVVLCTFQPFGRVVQPHHGGFQTVVAVLPLVQQANIQQHGNDGLKTSVMGLYYSTEWLKRAKDDYEEVSRLRNQAGAAGVRDLVTKARSAFGFHSPAVLKV